MNYSLDMRERAEHFGVTPQTIWHALRQLNIRKKTTTYLEANHSKRILYLRALRRWIKKYGSDNVVYFDESGFEAHSYRPRGWTKRGVKVHGKVTGDKRKGCINLIMTQRKKEWLAPMVFEGGRAHKTVLSWIEQALIPSLSD